MVHPRAGTVALNEDLVDVSALVTAYYALHPDVAEVSGVRTARTDALLAVLLSALITVCMNVLGVTLIAAMLVVVAIQLFDRWTIQIFLKLLRREFASTQSMLLDLTIILFVTVAAVAINIVFAVLIGVTVTVLFFLLRMSKSVVRRTYRCDSVHSRKSRDEKLMDLLGRHGEEILVYELEGPLFFGTAENLANQIDAAIKTRAAVAFDALSHGDMALVVAHRAEIDGKLAGTSVGPHHWKFKVINVLSGEGSVQRILHRLAT